MSKQQQISFIVFIEQYINKHLTKDAENKIFFANPKVWDIIEEESAAAELDLEKITKRLQKYLGVLKETIFLKDAILITNVTKNSWSVLALFNLPSYGKELMENKPEPKRFGAVYFSRKKPSNGFSQMLNILNKYLEKEHRTYYHPSKFVGNLTEKCVFYSDLKISVAKGLDYIFQYMKKNLELKLKKQMLKVNNSKNKPSLKAERSSKSKSQNADKSQTPDDSKTPVPRARSETPLNVKITSVAPENHEVEKMKRCVFVSQPVDELIQEEAGKPEVADHTGESQRTISTRSKTRLEVSEEKVAASNGLSHSKNGFDADLNPCVLSDDDPDEPKDDGKEFYYEGKSGEKFPFTKQDLQTLKPHEWINDSVLNFYLQYVLDQSSDAIRKQVCCFSSYFYQRLVSDIEESKKSGINQIRCWKQVKRLFDYKYAAIPINHCEHWFLVIMILPKIDSPSAKVQIFVLDSMLDPDDEFEDLTTNLMLYLRSELSNNFGKSLPKNDKVLKFSAPLVPQQKNGSDCGVFVLEFFEQFLKVLEEKKKFQDTNFKKWFPASSVVNKRKDLLKLIMSFKKSNGGDPTPTKKRRKTHPTNTSPQKKFLLATKRVTRQTS